uniref:RNA2 polyprotein n=1 Tax=Red clover mottle virus TaxID=12262 RepID=A0A2U8JA58_RCMV|nr:putative polyprotein 2 [Red clover mottle virus]
MLGISNLCRYYQGQRRVCANKFYQKYANHSDLCFFDLWEISANNLWIKLTFVLILCLFEVISGLEYLGKMAQEILKQGIPANVLQEKANLFKKASANNKIKDEIPNALSLYQNHSFFQKLKHLADKKNLDITSLPGGREVEYKHLDAGHLLADTNVVIDVPLVPQLAARTPTDYNFGTSRDKSATALHVGAIEVVIQSYASSECDLMAGMMLVDTFHSRPENAIRSVYIVPIRGGMFMRALCFPNTLVPMDSDINNRFKVVFSLPNNDFPQGSKLGHVSINMAGCTTSLSKTYVPSPLLTEELGREAATVIQYLGRDTYAMQTSNVPTSDEISRMVFNFHMEGKLSMHKTGSLSSILSKSKSLRYTVGGNKSRNKLADKAHDEEAESSDSKGIIDPKDGNVFANPQTDTDLFKLSLDDTSSPKGSLLDTRFAQKKVLIPKAMAGGADLLSSNLYDVLSGSSFRASLALARTHVVEGKIRCICTINLPENTGCCLAITVNSSNRGQFSTDIYTTGSQDRILWNPACSKNCDFSFNPNPCGTAWSLEFLRRTKFHLSVTCVSGWSAQPQTDIAMTMDWYVSNKPCVPCIYNVGTPGQNVWVNRWMGKLSFPQGSQNQFKQMPLAIGGGAGAKNSILMNMTNAFLSLWRYFHGDLVFEVQKMSSPFIKSTVTFFIGFGGLPFSENLEDFPNKLIQFGEVQERVEITFTRKEFLTAWSTQVDPAGPVAGDGCPYLCAMVHDSTASTITGDFNLGVTLLRIENFVGIGRNPGIQGARLLGSMQAEAQSGVVRTTDGVYSTCFRVRTPLALKDSGSFTCDLIGGGITTDSNTGWSLTALNTPVANLLRTAAWKRGTIHVQVAMFGSTVKRSDWTSTVQLFLRQSMNTSSYDARVWVISKPGAAILEFSFDVEGPNNGFEMWEANWASQTSWFLEFLISNVTQNTLFEVSMKLDSNFCVAGTTLMPPFSVTASPDSRPLLGVKTSTPAKKYVGGSLQAGPSPD